MVVKIFEKTVLFTVLLAMVFAAAGCQTELATYKDIASQELKAMIDQKENFTLVDVRTSQEFSASHIQDAKLIPVDEIEHALHDGKLETDEQIVVYCLMGGRSRQAAKILANQGFKKILNLQGGTQAWQKAGYPLVK